MSDDNKRRIVFFNTQFFGDGFTRDEAGRVGVPEFIGLNSRVDELPGDHMLIDIDPTSK